ncbi:hypothetical protein [Iodidimonas sp. SYSU 1G8]|uniref:hypothetical protein n=1 Tax=Iodidimonas sp. SYSU 1G8 TaxID=3133967 RepID=UPI0031FE9591
MKAMQLLLVGGVLVYLASRIAEIGWSEVRRSLPETIWFYVLFVAMYFVIPVAELFTYRTMRWRIGFWRSLPMFVRKRVYNYAVMSYSGEAYMFLWARRHLALGSRQILSMVKDNNLLSGLASNSFTLILVAAFFATGQLETILKASPDTGSYIGATVLVGALMVLLVIGLNRRIMSVPFGMAARITGIHAVRVLLILLLQTAQWAVVFPHVPFLTWLLFLTAQMVLTRLPLLPNQDLMLVGLGLGMSHYIDAPEAAVAGMFLVSGAMFQAANLTAFLLTSIGTYAPRPDEEEQAVASRPAQDQ